MQPINFYDEPPESSRHDDVQSAGARRSAVIAGTRNRQPLSFVFIVLPSLGARQSRRGAGRYSGGPVVASSRGSAAPGLRYSGA